MDHPTKKYKEGICHSYRNFKVNTSMVLEPIVIDYDVDGDMIKIIKSNRKLTFTDRYHLVNFLVKRHNVLRKNNPVEFYI